MYIGNSMWKRCNWDGSVKRTEFITNSSHVNVRICLKIGNLIETIVGAKHIDIDIISLFAILTRRQQKSHIQIDQISLDWTVCDWYSQRHEQIMIHSDSFSSIQVLFNHQNFHSTQCLEHCSIEWCMISKTIKIVFERFIFCFYQ